jgi:outer membrane protein assembly factor BamB
VTSLTEAWTADTGYPEAVLAGGVAYAGTDDGKLYAFDAAGVSGCSGNPKVCAPLWTSDPLFPTVPVVAGGVVYAGGSGDATVYAFDAAGVSGCSGSPKVCQPLWTGVGGPVVAPPAVANGVVYVTSFDGSLYAFDAAGVSGCSGVPKVCEPLWTAPTRGATSFDIRSAPAVVDGVVYVTDRDEGDLYAFDAAGVSGCSGSPKVCAPLWTAHTGFVESSPAVANGVVYVTSYYDGILHAFDAAGVSGCSGNPKVCEPLWTANLGDFLTSSPAVAGGVVYVGSHYNGTFYAFDAAGVSGCSGSPKVCTPLWTASTSGITYSAAAVAGDVVFVGSSTHLLAFDAAGASGCSGNPKVCTPLWSVPVPVGSSSPAVAGGVVYAGASDRKLHAYSLPAGVDTTAPMVTLTTPTEGGVYALGQVVNASYGCQDEAGGSGLASCVGTVASGTPIDTATVGAKTFTVAATDNATNTSSVTHRYSVTYSFSGFQAPVDNPNTVNTGKAGKTYPLKWQLRDANGNFISALSAVVGVVVKPTSCAAFTGDPTDALEATATGGTSLRYETGANQYIYNWATPTKGCYTLFLKLDSGQSLPAFFNLS